MQDIALTVHAHPTLGEMSMEVAEKQLECQSNNVIFSQTD